MVQGTRDDKGFICRRISRKLLRDLFEFGTKKKALYSQVKFKNSRKKEEELGRKIIIKTTTAWERYDK